ncbi:hypothetical protein VTH06DRAFT_8498 [Thermothelomyces fergusii]
MASVQHRSVQFAKSVGVGTKDAASRGRRRRRNCSLLLGLDAAGAQRASASTPSTIPRPPREPSASRAGSDTRMSPGWGRFDDGLSNEASADSLAMQVWKGRAKSQLSNSEPCGPHQRLGNGQTLLHSLTGDGHGSKLADAGNSPS